MTNVLRPARAAHMATEELEMLRSSVVRFCQAHAAETAVARWRENGIVDRAFWRLAGEAGLLGASVPVEYGGGGGDIRHDLVINEVMVEHDVGDFALPVSILVTGYLLAFGTETQKRNWLPKLCTGEVVGALAMTEPDAGSDLKAIKTTARLEDGHYVINGQKTFISAGHSADLVLVVCKTGEADGGGLSILLVEGEPPGFSRGRNLKKIGLEGMDTAELFFSDVCVPDSNLLGDIGAGFTMLMEELPKERLLTGTVAVQRMWVAIDEAISHAKLRKAFGRDLLDFQNTQFRLAECKTEATIGQVFLDHCVELYALGKFNLETAAMAKYWLTETEGRIIDVCLQIFGGYGYLTEYRIARLYKDTRVQRIYGGANEIMRSIIGRSL